MGTRPSRDREPDSHLGSSPPVARRALTPPSRKNNKVAVWNLGSKNMAVMIARRKLLDHYIMNKLRIEEGAFSGIIKTNFSS